MTRAFSLPSHASRADCEAYVYLCERPDVWRAWCAVMSARPRLCPSATAILIRVSGVPVGASHARSIGRIYRASHQGTLS